MGVAQVMMLPPDLADGVAGAVVIAETGPEIAMQFFHQCIRYLIMTFFLQILHESFYDVRVARKQIQ